MSVKEQIQKDLRDSIKGRRIDEVSALRFLNSVIINKEKEKRARIAKDNPGFGEKELVEKSQLIDEETLEVIMSEIKKRKESIIEFKKGKREDLVKKEQYEADLLKRYLPEQLSEDELRKLAKEAVEKTGAKEIRDMGRVLAELMPKVKGKADGSQISKIVKELLTPSM